MNLVPQNEARFTQDREQVLEFFSKFGDRTSSFVLLSEHFKSFFDPHSQALIRYVETKRAIVAANEPLCEPENRVSAFVAFGTWAGLKSKKVLMFPVPENLALASNAHKQKIGEEPVFDLNVYFNQTKDPLSFFPHARSFLRKGGQVISCDYANLTSDVLSEMSQLQKVWKKMKSNAPVAFLNKSELGVHGDQKKVYLLYQTDLATKNKKLYAFITAVPVKNKSAVYFLEVVRHPDSRAGMMESLFIESMRLAYHDKVDQVRLGTCALSGLKSNQDKVSRYLNFLFEKTSFLYSFKSHYQFKKKLQPTSWESVYAISNQPFSLKTARDILGVYYPQGFIKTQITHFNTRLFGFLLPRLMKPELLQVKALEKLSLKTIRYSLSCFVGLLALDILKNQTQLGQALYHSVGFSPLTWLKMGDGGSVLDAITSHFGGPLFHNNSFHFWGDTLSFVLFGALVEWAAGPVIFAICVYLGLWLSNPLIMAALWAAQKLGVAVFTPTFLNEIDYGSSNAVYALAGALCIFLKRPLWLFAPLAFDAVFIVTAKHNLLPLHHFTGMAMGMLSAWIWIKFREKHKKSEKTLGKEARVQ